jgi:hypothetical protein
MPIYRIKLREQVLRLSHVIVEAKDISAALIATRKAYDHSSDDLGVVYGEECDLIGIEPGGECELKPGIKPHIIAQDGETGEELESVTRTTWDGESFATITRPPVTPESLLATCLGEE